MFGPQPPDPKTTAAEQFNLNLKTGVAQTNLSRPNQVTPFGSSTWTQSGTNPDGTPRYTNTTTLDPRQQQLLNAGTAANRSAVNTARVDLTTMPDRGVNPTYANYGAGPKLRTNIGDAGDIQRSISGSGDYGAQRQQVQDALMGRVNADYERDRATREQELANKGIRPGSEAYNHSMDDYNRGLAEARTSATLGAGQEQSRLQGMDLNAGNFANQAQAQQFGQNAAGAQFFNTAKQQMLTNRNSQIAGNNDIRTQGFNNQNQLRAGNVNEINALRGGGQITQPNFQGQQGGGIAPVDYSGLAQNQFNGQNKQYNDMWNAVGGIGSAVGGWMFSDPDLKTDIEKIGETGDEQNIYTFRYKGSPMMQMGLMADEVQEKHPEAVREGPGGYRQVHYPTALKRAGGFMALRRAA